MQTPSATPGASISLPDTEKIRADLRMGDTVLYKGRPYVVAGIDPERKERQVALKNSNPASLDRGCVNFEDIEQIIAVGPRNVEKIAMESRVGYTRVMVGLVGKGEPEDGVFVVRDPDGVAHFNHDGREIEPGSADDARINSSERVTASRAKKPNPNWWNGFEVTDQGQ